MARLLIALFVWLLSPQLASAAITATQLGTVTAATASSFSITTSATATAGSTIVVCVVQSSGLASPALTMTDSASNSYNSINGSQFGTQSQIQCNYAFNISVLTSGSLISMTWNAAGGVQVVASAVFLSGTTTTDPLDPSCFGNVNINPPSTTWTLAGGSPGCTSNANEMSFCVWGAEGPSGDTYTQPSGYTTPPTRAAFASPTTGPTLNAGTQVLASATGTINCAASNSASRMAAGLQFAFLQGGGGGGATSDQSLPLTGFGN